MIEKNFELKIDLSPSIYAGSQQKGYGLIWCIVEGESFPEEEWTDFTVSCISILNTSLKFVLSGKDSPGTLEFLDGSFRGEFHFRDQQVDICLGDRNFPPEPLICQLRGRVSKVAFFAEVVEANRKLKKQIEQLDLYFPEWEQSWAELAPLLPEI
jgi:hypothetical protein